ncbi:hypothetical protein CKAH01_16459 [Colletotrichum kahawae]|uniref:Uncharacterized protein n=1 Tax=Colletotrichum kahawae TaxID=34407 RepID=A0AAD9YCZ6_COLKA|nr:hypothetical protein CKAH01_16459 [Colletotrichum kahawae]
MHIIPISPNIPISDSRENTPTFSFFYHHYHYHYHYGLINIYTHFNYPLMLTASYTLL